MVMNPVYEQEVRHQCPIARIVHQLFHVVAKYGREVSDRGWVDEANRLRHDKPACKVVKGARRLLVKNRAKLASRPGNSDYPTIKIRAAPRPLARLRLE